MLPLLWATAMCKDTTFSSPLSYGVNRTSTELYSKSPERFKVKLSGGCAYSLGDDQRLSSLGLFLVGMMYVAILISIVCYLWKIIDIFVDVLFLS